MEIRLEVMYEDMNRDGSRSADALRRKIFELYPDAIWDKYGNGHRILV
jgi:hypothetical protein